jgi:glycine/serine hydroxymethyltransferase
MGPDQMRIIADVVDRAVAAREDEAVLETLRGETQELCGAFPLYPGL